MNTKQTIVAALVGGFLVGGPAFAKEKWEFHESDWSSTKSYAGVALTEDSVGSWGPWAAFEEPAAGLPTRAQMPGAGGTNPYRVIPTVISTASDSACQSGQWCGYAVFDDTIWTDSEEVISQTRPHPGRFILGFNPADPATVKAGSGKGPGDSTWQLVPLDGFSPFYTDSGGNMPTGFGPGLGNFSAYRSSTSGDVGQGAGAYGESSNGNYYFYFPTSNPEATAGYFYRYIQNYVSGEGDGYWVSKETFGLFVAGITTPQTYLDAQRTGNVTATYSGFSGSWSGVGTPVNITVNFGNSTWNGSWNNGRDGSAWLYTDTSGNKYWAGNVGFNASGTISGANIASTSITAKDGTIGAGSSVKGTFFGKEAGSIGGVSDIVKTKTVGETVQTASHTAVFLVDKGARLRD